ncbi:tyrosine-type recombinase/integrase [Williamsia soli]|uniref:tyrosine-type recombinase/integrase n=1 Tax=Williamsia soli TaxID=364929 RepID=UPI001A9CC384|nr:site-specific integrase [Williamsia soli]
MADFRTRRAAAVAAESGGTAADTGLADVETLQSRAVRTTNPEDEATFYLETLAEYSWARDVAGLAPSTLKSLIKPVIEVCEYYDCVPWRLTPREFDRYFSGPGRQHRATTRKKVVQVDNYFAFLERRYGGEISRRFGVSVESPVDLFNRPRHRGDFALRIPPTEKAMNDFFAAWRVDLPHSRKYPIAARDYVMAKICYLSGVRASELCAVKIGDVHWERGQWGRFVVTGKGARGSGPRQREAFLFAEGRELLWWYMEEIRGQFCDDPTNDAGPLWPSERLPAAVAALNLAVAPAIVPETFRRTLKQFSRRYLPGPVPELYPHLMRHACATHNYENGMPLWDVQKLLGHEWPSTTVGYLASAGADPERTVLESTQRAVRRLGMEG